MKSNFSFVRELLVGFFSTSRKTLFQLTFLLLVSFGYGQTTKTETLPTDKISWLVPCGVTSITIQAWGGGGGGGYRQLAGAANGYGSAGGGGGAYEVRSISVIPNETIDYGIGAGGSGGSISGALKKDGEDTFVRKGGFNLIVAAGGKGADDNTVQNDKGTYGLGGVKTTVGGHNGGKGGNAGKATNGVDFGGGGGGAGHPGGPGGPGGTGSGGTSSTNNLLGGAGGKGGENTSTANPKAPGSPGLLFGGGGGGSLKFSSKNTAASSPLGGAGGNGGIIITYTLPATLNAGRISSIGETICYNTRPKVQIGSDAVATGGDGNYTYRWQYSTDSSFETLVNTVPSSNTATYTPTQTLTETTYYRRQVKDGLCNSTFVDSGGVWMVTVGPSFSLTKVEAGDACNSSRQSTVTVSALPANLPTGNYQVSYKINNSNPELTATMNVATAGRGAFIADVSVLRYEDTGTLTITKISNGTCSSVMSIQSNSLRVVGVTKPSVSQGDYQCDKKWIAQWTPVNYANGYIVDVSIFSDFSTIFKTYTVTAKSTVSQIIDNLAFGGTYYYRVQATSDLCEPSPYSNPIKFTIVGNNSSTPGTISGVATLCLNNSSQFTVSGSNPVTGTWSVFNETGSATISTAGVVTGVAAGKVKVVFTTMRGGCSTSTTKDLTIAVAGTISAASSSPIVCVNSLITNITHTTTVYTGIGNPIGLPAGLTANFLNNTITISGTPTVSGNFNYTIPLIGGCGSENATGTIKINPASISPILKDVVQPSCSTTTGSFTIANYDKTNNYIFSPSINVVNDNGNVTAPPGKYTITSTTNNCSSAATTVTINAVPVTPAMPNVDKIGQPTCDVSTGSVLLSNLPAKGWTINPGNIRGTGSTTIITGLAPGTYQFTVSNASCSSVATTDVVINSITKIWNGTMWSAGGAAPTTEQAIVINGKYTSTGDLNGCSCIINSGDVIISSGHTLKLQNQLEVNGAATFTLADGAVLLQENKDAANKGKISVERYVKGLRNQPGKAVDYVYWSSPVTGQQTKGPGGFSPGTPNANFFFYNEANDRFYETGDVTFTRGRGYAVRAETIINPATGLSDTNPYNKTYQFTGAPINGDISRDIARSNDNPAGVVHGYNLVGNPYPSVIDFNELYLGNCKGKDGTDCLIYNTAWFWTNNVYTANQMGSGYGGNNYAIFNGTGGVPATSPYTGGLRPDGMIGVGQAFIVQKKTTGTAPLQFKNSYAEGHKLRVSTPSTFFQKVNGEKNKFSMKLISPSQLVNTQLIGYVTGATDGYEQDFDAEAFGDFSDLFYSVLDNKKMVIQGKDGNFSADDRVTLGAIFFQNGTYTIELGETEGIFSANQYIYLKDKQANIITNLSQSSYTFTAFKGNTANRFEIVYKPEMVLSTEGMVNENIFVYKDDNDFVVKANRKNITALEMYDTAGRLMLKLKPNSLKVFISMEKMVNGVYILKIDQNGEMTTKKVIK